jgi:hypothetical protein
MSEVKLKMNTPVLLKNSRSEPKLGRYAGAEDRGPGKGGGTWLKVNVADKGKPQVIRYARPAHVEPA